ncbi:MAG: hypothetical protein ABJA86_04380 [Nocardioidaceae bacterium]
MTEPFISAEIAYRQEKIRASFANAEARRRYRLERRALRSQRALPQQARSHPVVSR